MRVFSSVSKLGRSGRRKGMPARKPPGYRLGMEALEARTLLSTDVLQTNLVSDLPNVAQLQDPNLVNPWGISEGGTGPFWISDNNAGLSTLYNVPGANNTPVSINPLVVSIPTPGRSDTRLVCWTFAESRLRASNASIPSRDLGGFRAGVPLRRRPPRPDFVMELWILIRCILFG